MDADVTFGRVWSVSNEIDLVTDAKLLPIKPQRILLLVVQPMLLSQILGEGLGMLLSPKGNKL